MACSCPSRVKPAAAEGWGDDLHGNMARCYEGPAGGNLEGARWKAVKNPMMSLYQCSQIQASGLGEILPAAEVSPVKLDLPWVPSAAN